MARALIAALFLLPCVASAQDPELFEVLDQNVASAWRTLGPLSAAEHAGLAHEFFDETALDPTAVTTPDQTWVERDFADGRAHSLRALGASDWDTVYLHRTITAVADHAPTISFGMDDSAAIWVNGEEVFRVDAHHVTTCAEYQVPIRLRAGDNSILIKVVNDDGGMSFCYSLGDGVEDATRWGAGLSDDGFGQYAVTTVPIPDDLTVEVGALQFMPDGSLLVACRRGRIYRIHNPAENDPGRLRITTFAEGLHEPLGMLLEDDGSLLVTQIPELTRLRDTDGDGRADRFETVAQPWGLSGNYHEYHFGPVRDGNGDLWGTLNIGFPSGDGPDRLYRGSAYRLSPTGEFSITCYGLRSPNGLVTNDDGDVFYTDNQGEWMDVCRLAHLQPRKYYGHAVPLQWAEAMTDFGWEQERTLPAVWYPYHLMRSTSWPVVDRTGGKFGPYQGQIIVGDQNNALLVRTTLQRVNGVYQGACYPFWQGFACGVNRLAFDREGVLYVGLTERGWGSVGPKSFGIQRVHYRGPTPFDIAEVTATRTGFEMRFTKPLAADVAMRPAKISIREYGYHYWSTYGSEEIDEREVAVERVSVSADRTWLRITTGPRNRGKAFQISLRGEVRSADGEPPIAREAFYTLLEIPN